METENEVGEVTEENDPKPLRQCCKDDFGFETKSDIRRRLSEKENKRTSQYQLSNQYIQTKHMLHFFW